MKRRIEEEMATLEGIEARIRDASSDRINQNLLLLEALRQELLGLKTSTKPESWLDSETELRSEIGMRIVAIRGQLNSRLEENDHDDDNGRGKIECSENYFPEHQTKNFCPAPYVKAGGGRWKNKSLSDQDT